MFNATQPSLVQFEDADKLTDVPAASTPTRFAFGQDGTSVPASGNRLLWLKLGMPRITSTESPQELRVTVRAQAP